jgi:hypothetical protein
MLDRSCTTDGLLFMPEMSAVCGREFRVLKRADKVNDLVTRSGLRRMKDTVLLEAVRCSGDAHGGCQARCQTLWKESWLERVTTSSSEQAAPRGAVGGCQTPALLARLSAVTTKPADDLEPVYSCQATEMKRASSYLAWWDPRQYYKDLASGNVALSEMMRAFGFWLFTLLLRIGGYRRLVAMYNTVQRWRGGDPYPYVSGTLRKTPTARLDLRVGELVEVKSFNEVVATLDVNNKNRGLWFDVEMVKYCGGKYRVLARVDRIINEATGKMTHLTSDCLILDGVTIQGDFHRFYPQNEYPLWREIWLKRCDG